jgi:putative transposase
MKKLTHSESEIVKSVNELEAGVSADEICRRLNVSRATLYQWKRKYGGLEVSQLKKLKELEEENAKLKKMYANLALDNEILREVIEKNSDARGPQGDCGRDSRGTRHQHYSGVQIDGHPQVVLLLRIYQG